MTISNSPLTTKLGRVRGLGSAGHGLTHWWLQRVTAVALIPLSLWFMASLIMLVQSPDVIHVAEWMASPLNALLMVLFLVAIFIHAKLGLQMVIEDYVKKPVAKYGLLLANSFICFLFAAISILAVLKMHLLDISTTL